MKLHYRPAATAVKTSHLHFRATKPALRLAKRGPHPYDRYLPALIRAFVETIQRLAADIDPENPDFDALQLALEVAMAPIITNLMELGAKGAALELFQFDLLNLDASNAALGYTGWLITSILEETRTAIQQVMQRAFTEGLHPRDSGKLIADALRAEPLDAALAREYGVMSVGLNPRLANAVFNYAGNLTAQGYQEATVVKKAQDYSERLLQYRGNLIARTETIRASNMGQQALWNGALDTGLIDRTATIVKVWSASPSERTCVGCLDVDGDETEVDGSFSTPWGTMDYPPGHPDCRCSCVLRYTDLQPPRQSALDRLAQATESQLGVDAASMGGDGEG